MVEKKTGYTTTLCLAIALFRAKFTKLYVTILDLFLRHCKFWSLLWTADFMLRRGSIVVLLLFEVIQQTTVTADSNL